MDRGKFDRLSLLPESLLANEILSRLELREAVATCVLSKMWRFMWTKLPSFHLTAVGDFVNRMIAVELPFLRSLSLCRLTICQEKLETLVSRCPLLESLELTMCRDLYRVAVGNPSVRRLRVKSHLREWRMDSISAPHIRELVVEGAPMRVLDASNLERATINVYCALHIDEWKEGALLLLEDIRHVNNLDIGGSTAYLIRRLASKSPGFQLFKQFSLQNLAVRTLTDSLHIYGIIAILRSSPNIHTLIVQNNHLVPYENDETQGTLDCDVLLHLKFVEIAFLDTFTLKLAQFILEKAPSLEEMVFRQSLDRDFIKKLHYPISSRKAKLLILQ